MSYDAYVEQQHSISELESRLSVYAHLAQALDDVKLGRTQKADSVFDDHLQELEGFAL